MKRRVLFVAGLVAVAASTLALAGRYANVWDNDQPQARDWKHRGYCQVPQPANGELRSDDTITRYVTLKAGYQYKIFDVCAENCDDIDLELRDENGNLVVYDSHADDLPYVTVTPRYTQRYRFKVRFYACYSDLWDDLLGMYGL